MVLLQFMLKIFYLCKHAKNTVHDAKISIDEEELIQQHRQASRARRAALIGKYTFHAQQQRQFMALGSASGFLLNLRDRFLPAVGEDTA